MKPSTCFEENASRRAAEQSPGKAVRPRRRYVWRDPEWHGTGGVRQRSKERYMLWPADYHAYALVARFVETIEQPRTRPAPEKDESTAYTHGAPWECAEDREEWESRKAAFFAAGSRNREGQG